MITRLRLENYRSHTQSEFPLHPMNLMVGPVAAGKSNILKGLLLVQNSINRPLAELFPPGLGEFRWVRNRWAGEGEPIGFEIDLAGFVGRPGLTATYTLRIADSPSGLYVREESLRRRESGGPEEWIFRRGLTSSDAGSFGPVEPTDSTLLNRVHRRHPYLHAGAPGVTFAEEVATRLNRFGCYHLSVPELRSLGTGQAWDRIGYEGSRLPDFIAWAKSDEQSLPIYERILGSLREILPELESILITQPRARQQGLALSFFGQRGYIAAPDLSDGTLLTLGLLSLIHGPRRPALLSVEEPESGLNPRGLRRLFEQFMALAFPRDGAEPTQILFSTQSPWLIELFRDTPESVIWIERKEGRSCVTPLTEMPTEVPGAGHWADCLRDWL